MRSRALAEIYLAQAPTIPDGVTNTGAELFKQGGFAAVAVTIAVFAGFGLWFVYGLFKSERAAKEKVQEKASDQASNVITNEVKFTEAARELTNAVRALDAKLDRILDLLR